MPSPSEYDPKGAWIVQKMGQVWLAEVVQLTIQYEQELLPGTTKG